MALFFIYTNTNKMRQTKDISPPLLRRLRTATGNYGTKTYIAKTAGITRPTLNRALRTGKATTETIYKLQNVQL